MNPLIAGLILFLKLDVEFPMGGGQLEQIFLRWLHIVAAIIWIGLLYYFNLVSFPSMKDLDSGTRAKVIATFMPRAMWWFRWSALVVWIVGFRYFMILAQTDAAAIGTPSAAARWLVEWFACWVVASVLIVGVMQMSTGPLKNGWLVAAIVILIFRCRLGRSCFSGYARSGEPHTIHKPGRWAGDNHDVPGLGTRVALPEKGNWLGAGAPQRRHRDASRNTKVDERDIRCGAHWTLDFISDDLFHGGIVTLSISVGDLTIRRDA